MQEQGTSNERYSLKVEWLQAKRAPFGATRARFSGMTYQAAVAAKVLLTEAGFAVDITKVPNINGDNHRPGPSATRFEAETGRPPRSFAELDAWTNGGPDNG